MTEENGTSRLTGQEDALPSARAKSKLGRFGAVLALLGSILFWGSLLIGFFILAAGGGLDIMDPPHKEVMFFIFAGLFLVSVGGILGAIDLLREENLISSIFALILGIIPLALSIAVPLIATFG